MGQGIELLTAETAQGRHAIVEVMERSYTADVESVPPRWARVRIVDNVPVSFILVDSDRRMDFPDGELRYAFICDAATRKDRRREGHFRGIMEDTFADLRAAGIPMVVTHGRHPLYPRFGFDVFTHHCGIYATPGLIDRRLGTGAVGGARELLQIDEGKYVQKDLLLVTVVKAGTLSECKAALQVAAALARERGKARILFEHPSAPSYGSRYPIYPSPETNFTILARACGAEVCIQGADPESGSIPDADWIKVLDAAAFVRRALQCARGPKGPLPSVTVCLDTDAGSVTIESLGGRVLVSEIASPDAITVRWPSSALAQLVVGYQSAEVLSTIHNRPLPTDALTLLKALFPPRWRFSRNESWTFRP